MILSETAAIAISTESMCLASPAIVLPRFLCLHSSAFPFPPHQGLWATQKLKPERFTSIPLQFSLLWGEDFSAYCRSPISEETRNKNSAQDNNSVPSQHFISVVKAKEEQCELFLVLLFWAGQRTVLKASIKDGFKNNWSIPRKSGSNWEAGGKGQKPHNFLSLNLCAWEEQSQGNSHRQVKSKFPCNHRKVHDFSFFSFLF